MLSLPSALIVESNKLNSNSAWVILLEITIPVYGVIRLAKNNEDVIFGGNTYTAFPMEIDTSSWSTKGEIPSIDVKVSNIANTFTTVLREYDGGVGATVVFRVVSSEYLGEDYAELTRTFEVLSTYVDSYWVSFTLGSDNPLVQRFPLYTYMARHCNWVQNFKGAECKYNDVRFSDVFITLDSKWVQHGTTAELAVVVSAGASNGYALSIGNNVGDDEARLIHSKNVLYASNNLHKVEVRCRVVSGIGIVILGIVGVAADGTTLISTLGTNILTNHHYFAANGPSPATFTTYTGYFKGLGTPAGGVRNDINAPGLVYPGVKYIRPILLVNFDSVPGVTEIDYVKIETINVSCNGTYDQCQDYDNVTNFGGFPGLYNPEVRIVS